MFRAADSKKSGMNSVMKLPISNALGLDAQRAQNILKIYCLNKPTEYSITRQKVFDCVVTDAVSSLHQTIWALLSSGVYVENDTEKHIDFEGSTWSPQLPDADIAEISNKFAKSQVEMWNQLFSDVLPDRFEQMAAKKMTTSANISTGSAASMPAVGFSSSSIDKDVIE